MKLHIIFIIALCWICIFSRAQTSQQPVIVSTIYRSGYFHIPPAALADTVKGVLCQLRTDKKIDLHKRPIEFYWTSTCNDGYYNLTITPEQVFFSSSHDNPNPNYLFWVMDIDSVQYQQIRKALQQKTPLGFENMSKHYGQSLTVFYDGKFKDTVTIPEDWTDNAMQQFDRYCKVQVRSQLEKYFAVINACIADKTKILAIPPELAVPKYFSYSRTEMLEWMPVKVRMPDVIK